MKPPSSKRQVLLSLIHDGAQPGTAVAEPVRFGLQDTKSEVHPGKPVRGAYRFELPVEVKGQPGSAPIFSGPFCQGSPAGRFLYLSWKREGKSAAPWAWRIKIPLADISWRMIQEASRPDRCIQADVRDRRPHVTGPIAWVVHPRARFK